MFDRLKSMKTQVIYLLGFLTLAVSFLAGWWQMPYARREVTTIDSTFTELKTVRMSASQLYERGGDTSMIECYSCHEQGSSPVLEFNEYGELIWEEHTIDFELEHGSSHLNEYCYNCHNQENLEQLKNAEGMVLDITQSNVLCGGCHGTTYRDWTVGIHGRQSGFWNSELGDHKHEDCVSCHNPHSPAFQPLPPWPGPQSLRPVHPSSLDSTSHEE